MIIYISEKQLRIEEFKTPFETSLLDQRLTGAEDYDLAISYKPKEYTNILQA